MKDKIFVASPFLPDINEYMNEVKDIFDAKYVTNMGPKHNKFKEILKEKLKVNNLDLVVNGHMALENALQALELEGEVITTPFTFISTTNAIVRNNLIPIFCDVDPTTLTIDANKIEDLITEKTSAIMPVHIYGNICDVEKIEEIARKHKLKVIYDAAQAFGIEYKGNGIGSYGDLSCFSLHATKIYNSVEGGVVCAKEESILKKLEIIKNFGLSGEDVLEFGGNSKMSEFHAAMGICNSKYIKDIIARRKELYDKYKEKLNNLRDVKILENNKSATNNYAYFVILVDKDKRDNYLKHLESNNIYARKYFYPLTNEVSCYKDKFDLGYTPIAKEASEKVLTLPLHTNLTDEQADKIISLTLDFFNN